MDFLGGFSRKETVRKSKVYKSSKRCDKTVISESCKHMVSYNQEFRIILIKNKK